MKKAHWFIIFLFFAISCLDEPDCFRLNNNIIGIAFKKMYDGKADTIRFFNLQALAAPDITFIDPATSYASEVYVPLDFFTRETDFTLEALYDIHHLRFGYDVKTQFVSEDCGARYVLNGLSLLQHDYDSIHLVSTTPTSSAAGVHLQVYRCPRTNFMKFTFRQLQGEASEALTPKINSISPDYMGAIFVDTTLNAVNLPLNPGANQVRFGFDFKDYGSNFVTVQYTRRAWDYQPNYCGDRHLQFFAKLDIGEKDEGFDFDSLIVVKDSLRDPPVTNIVAYRCPDIGFMRVSFRTPSAPVVADSLKVVKLTDDKGTVFYQNVNLSIFTLPLISDAGITSTEFTFELQGGTVKKLKINYTQDSKQVFKACGVQTTFNALSIESTDFSSKPGTPTSTPKVDHTTFPILTNFEIIQ
jgi:hypothetical protein